MSEYVCEMGNPHDNGIGEIVQTCDKKERVIRCRDCAHFHEWDAPEGHYETCDRGPSNNWVGDDGFCAWAEPRDES